MVVKLDHIAVAVRSLEAARKLYERLGLPVAGIETLPAEQVRVAMIPLGETRIELREPTAEGSTIARFIEKRGEGLHHLAIEVDDLAGHLQRLEAAGVRIIPPKAEAGAGGHRYVFLHPASCGGVLVELVEAARVEKAR
jgi:methylmalonyl-CoA epimerase